jgi:hypothetical protein
MLAGRNHCSLDPSWGQFNDEIEKHVDSRERKDRKDGVGLVKEVTSDYQRLMRT